MAWGCILGESSVPSSQRGGRGGWWEELAHMEPLTRHRLHLGYLHQGSQRPCDAGVSPFPR